MPEDLTFTFFWRDGAVDVLEGQTSRDALTRAGFGADALGALDFFGNGILTSEYQFDSAARKWDRVEHLPSTD